MSIEDALRAAAEKGLTHLTLYPIPSTDQKTVFWAARATPSTGHSYVQTTSLDPVEALTQVLEALPRAPKRTPRKESPRFDSVSPPLSELAQRAAAEPGTPTPDVSEIPVTAAVTADTPEDINTWLPKT